MTANPWEITVNCTKSVYANFDALPTVDLTQEVTPATLPEPGGVFTYMLTITNAWVRDVTITAFTGDNPLSAECEGLIGTAIPAGGTVSCTYGVTHTHAGSYSNTASVTVQDNENNTASDSDDETVTVTDELPTVDLTKSASPSTLLEPGGVFTFTLTIKNTSVEPVTITSLTDDDMLSTECLALVATSIPAGGTVSCTYGVTHSDAGSYSNTASVTVQDNEGNSTSESDDETVIVTEAPLWSPWFYDTNLNGLINKAEAVAALVDYFGLRLSKPQVIQVLLLYFGGAG